MGILISIAPARYAIQNSFDADNRLTVAIVRYLTLLSVVSLSSRVEQHFFFWFVDGFDREFFI